MVNITPQSHPQVWAKLQPPRPQRIKVVIRANGETYDGEIWTGGAGFSSNMPDGENRFWAEVQAWHLVDDRSLSSIEDAENLRGVALEGHGFCLSALNG